MNKFVKVILCIGILFTTLACSKQSSSPSDVTENFLAGYKNKNEEQIRAYSQWKDYSVKALHIQKTDYIEGVDKKLQKEVFEMMQDFDYTIGKQTLQDDHASVLITLTSFNFDPVIKSGLEEAKRMADELSKQSEVPDSQAEAKINTILFTHMKTAKKNKKETIAINLVKEDNTWLISNDNADIQNILISNMQSLQNSEN